MIEAVEVVVRAVTAGACAIVAGWLAVELRERLRTYYRNR